MAAALALTIPSVPASAANVTGKVGQLSWLAGSSTNTTLFVMVNGVNYMGYLTAQAGCETNNQTMDTLKIWHAMAQGALLSGKSLRIYFNNCSGPLGNVPFIAQIDLVQ